MPSSQSLPPRPSEQKQVARRSCVMTKALGYWNETLPQYVSEKSCTYEVPIAARPSALNMST